MEGTPLTNILDDSKNQVVPEDLAQSSLTEPINADIQADDEPEIQVPPAKKKYAKISNDRRLELIDSVENQGQNIKEAAKRLDMNYSSAKSICQVFKKEGRSKKKTFKQRFEKGSDSNVNLNMPNPPCENPELQKLLAEPTNKVSQQSQSAEDASTKKPTLMELRDKLLESRLGKSTQIQNMQTDNSGTDTSSISAPSSGRGGMQSQSSQTNDEGRNQQGQNYMYAQDYNNNQNQQMQQGNVYIMQQHGQPGNETYSLTKIAPQQQQQQQQQQGYMVYQGNMQPVFMTNSQPMYQSSSFQGYQQNNYKDQNQQQQQQQQQQAKNPSPDFSNQNVYISSNSNSSNTYTSYHQNQQTSSYMMVPVNQPQYYMMSAPSNTYFVSTQSNNNNNSQQNNYQPMQMQQMQQVQPMMYMQSQPNYYMQTFTATNDIYMPQQSGGYFVMGENQNQNQNQNQQGNNQGGSGDRSDQSNATRS